MGEKLVYEREEFRSGYSGFCVASTLTCNNKFLQTSGSGRRSDSERKLTAQTMTNESVLPRMNNAGCPKRIHLGFKESDRKKPRKLSTTSVGSVEKNTLEESTPFYETKLGKKEILSLSVQSQRDLVQKIRPTSVRKLNTFEVDKDYASLKSEKLKYRGIQPVSIQLLTARVGGITMDLANYISKETVGRQPIHNRSTVMPKAPKCPLDALTDIYHKAVTSQEISYPICASVPNIPSNRLSVISLGSNYRIPRRYSTKSRRLFTVHPGCVQRRQLSISLDLETSSGAEKKISTAKQTRSQNKSVLSSSCRSTGTHYSKSLRKAIKKVAQTRKPALFPLEVLPHRPVSPEAPLSFMSEETETTSEDNVPPEDDFLTVSQTDRDSQWRATSIGTFSYRKTQNDSKTLEEKKIGTIIIPRRSAYFKIRRMQRLQHLREPCRLSIFSNSPDGINFLRHLLQLLTDECNPRATYNRYRQDRQILFELNLAELSKSYSPQAVKEIRQRLVRLCHRSEIVLNNHESMYYLQQRLEEIHKNKILQMESTLEQQEAERFRLLLFQNPQNKDTLEAELLRRGKLIYHQLCNNPVILMPKVQREKKSLPVFSVNPTWNRYKDCYVKENCSLQEREVSENQDLLPKQYSKSKTAKLAWEDKRKLPNSSPSKFHLELLPRETWMSDMSFGGEEVKYPQQSPKTRYFLPKRSVIHGQISLTPDYFTGTDEETTENIMQVYQTAQRLLEAARLENI